MSYTIFHRLTLFNKLPQESSSSYKDIAEYPYVSQAEFIDGRSVSKNIGVSEQGRSALQGSLEKVSKAFQKGIRPELTADGTAGSYILRDSSKHALGVFKPIDEEAYAPCNPRGYVGTLNSLGIRSGVLSGEAGFREVAASLIDRSVPSTVLVQSAHASYRNSGNSPHTKIGSFQAYVDNVGCAEDFAPCKFSKDDVHRIGILDIRILNMDRNTTNLLVSKELGLVPIDHGMSFPRDLKIDVEDVAWMGWAQAKQPFSKQVLEQIQNMDARQDYQTVCGLIKNDIALKNARAATLLLQKAAAKGLCLFDIGRLIYRDDDSPSVLEEILEKTAKSYFSKKKPPEESSRAESYEKIIAPGIKFFSMPVCKLRRSEAFDEDYFALVEEAVDEALGTLEKQSVDSK